MTASPTHDEQQADRDQHAGRRSAQTVRPGIRLTNDQRRRLAKAILAEFDGLEAVRLIVELGLGWAEPYGPAERAHALGIVGLTPEQAIAKVRAGLRQAAGETAQPPGKPRDRPAAGNWA